LRKLCWCGATGRSLASCSCCAVDCHVCCLGFCLASDAPVCAKTCRGEVVLMCGYVWCLIVQAALARFERCGPPQSGLSDAWMQEWLMSYALFAWLVVVSLQARDACFSLHHYLCM
jgi:hypothetical protein